MAFDAASFLKSTSNKPGVYQMLDATQKVIYVGKAKNLKKRLQSYFRKELDSNKTKLVMSKVVDIHITVTNSENEALILENNLIKDLKPRYNILMRDDKSYPYIVLSKHAKFPRLSAYRGVKKHGQDYFGPYPNASAVKETLEVLQKLFQLRSCTQNFFQNRSRPCLQHQIKRCSAPCVGYITTEKYQQDIDKARLFLKGKNKQLVKELSEKMQHEAQQLNYEQAALLRNQINKLDVIQEQQHVMQAKGSFDVVAIATRLEQTAINILNVDDGKLLGTKNHIIKTHNETLPNVLAAFLSQHYLDVENIPKLIIVNLEPTEHSWLSSAIMEHAGHTVQISMPQRGDKLRWLELAHKNLEQALFAHIQKTLSQKKRWQELTETMQWESQPNRIECFDISHSQGEATVASCVVFNEEGPLKKDYRRYNIKDIIGGDDYAALHQAIQRRYSRLQKEEKMLPNVVIIDGGKGQLQQAIDVFEELKITNVFLMSISKGPGRNPNYDVIWRAGDKQAMHLPSDSISLHLIQQIRDEAHRFAITGHKAQRGKLRQHSILEDIEGVGAKRRQQLLKAFGGLQGLQQASLEQLSTIEGINETLALRIYQHLH